MGSADLYLEEQMKAPEFAAPFERAGEAWSAALRIQAGMSRSEKRGNKKAQDGERMKRIGV